MSVSSNEAEGVNAPGAAAAARELREADALTHHAERAMRPRE